MIIGVCLAMRSHLPMRGWRTRGVHGSRSGWLGTCGRAVGAAVLEDTTTSTATVVALRVTGLCSCAVHASRPCIRYGGEETQGLSSLYTKHDVKQDCLRMMRVPSKTIVLFLLLDCYQSTNIPEYPADQIWTYPNGLQLHPIFWLAAVSAVSFEQMKMV
eukprot:4110512-Pleurochrysis_carterae.AAC.2